jgi:Protein of unknown function (DUF3011)
MRILGMRLFLMFAAVSIGAAANAQTVSCTSEDGSKKYCQADTKHGVTLAKQRSDAACRLGESWGFDDRGIWVAHGCGGDFVLGAEASGQGGAKIVFCASDGGKRFCDVNTGGGVRLARQKSDAPCKQDATWGYDGLGIWVDQGCSADFAIGAAAVTAPRQPAKHADAGDSDSSDVDKTAKDRSCLKTAGKSRAEQLVKECLKVSAATHPPCNAQNSCELIVDEIRRSCVFLGADAPAFCGGYLK